MLPRKSWLSQHNTSNAVMGCSGMVTLCIFSPFSHLTVSFFFVPSPLTFVISSSFFFSVPPPTLQCCAHQLFLQRELKLHTRMSSPLHLNLVCVCVCVLLCCLPGPVTISVLWKQLRTILSGRKHQVETQPWGKMSFFSNSYLHTLHFRRWCYSYGREHYTFEYHVSFKSWG